MHDLPVQKPIHLSEGKPNNLAGILHLLMEYMLFFRWIVFKNRPRGNFLLIRSFLAVGFQGSLYFLLIGDLELLLLGIEIDPIIALGIGVIIAFWNMSKSYHEKTKTCFAAYREILNHYADGKAQKAELLSTYLAINLLTMDFWAHPSFCGIFRSALFAAIDQQSPKDVVRYKNLLENGCMCQDIARSLLVSHQESQLKSVGFKSLSER